MHKLISNTTMCGSNDVQATLQQSTHNVHTQSAPNSCTFEPDTAISSSVTIVTQVTASWCPQSTCSALPLIPFCDHTNMTNRRFISSPIHAGIVYIVTLTILCHTPADN